MYRLVSSPVLASPIGCLLAVALWLPAVAGAQCLTGPTPTGLEVGPQTLSVTVINMSAVVALTGTSCNESQNQVDPGQGPGGTGQARFKANHLGYRAYTAAVSGGQAAGSGGASVGGAVRYLVRVESTPSYAGPATVDVDIAMLVAASGAIQVSGQATAGGTFSSEMSLRPLDSQIGVILFNGNGALAGASPTLLQATTPMDVDREYVIQIVHSQIVMISASFAPMGGGLGSASSGGTVAISFGADLSVPDPELSIEYLMTDALGVSAPSVGNPPVFGLGVPALGGPGAAVLVIAMLLAAVAAMRQWARVSVSS